MTRSLDRRTAAAWLAAFVVLALAGCTGVAPTAPPPGTTIQPGPPMSQGELRLFLESKLGPLWYCDPDSYPVGRDEQLAAIERYAEMVAEDDLFRAAATEVGIDPNAAAHSDAQKLAIYRRWKVGRAVALEPIGDARYRFDFLAQPADGAAEGTRSAGIIDDQGRITIEQAAPAGEPMCPICLDRETSIDAPAGAIPVARLRLGDVVWTLDGRGRRVEGTVIALGSTPAPAGHHVIRLTLADGRSVTASPGHPLADGRTLAALALGDEVDGRAVVGLERIGYEGGETFDLAVSGATGVYFAAGIPLGSTLD